jgi:hypothetical protein
MSAQNTIFVIAKTMKTAEAWAIAHGVLRDRWRYAVNTRVFEVMGPRDQYVIVPTAPDRPDFDALMRAVQDKHLTVWSAT